MNVTPLNLYALNTSFTADLSGRPPSKALQDVNTLLDELEKSIKKELDIENDHEVHLRIAEPDVFVSVIGKVILPGTAKDNMSVDGE